MPRQGANTFDHAAIVKLAKEGYVAREIAAELGCSKSLAENVVKGARDAGEAIPRARRSTRDPNPAPALKPKPKPKPTGRRVEGAPRSPMENDGMYLPVPKITDDEARTVRNDLKRRGLDDLIAMLGVGQAVAS
jgi:hypothetical protein